MNRFWWMAIVVGVLVGCAGRGPVVDHSEIYMKHASDPVPRVRYERIRGWQPVGREMVMMDFGARGQYLFELSRECHSRLHTTLTLHLDNYQPRVIDITDRIIIDEVHRCRIMNMWPVDLRAVRDELATRDEGVIERGVETAHPDDDH